MPDKGCENFDCHKCLTVSKQPNCVTNCLNIFFKHMDYYFYYDK